MLLCCVLCKRNWKNQVCLGALWGRKLLRGAEKGEKGKTPHCATPQLRMWWQEPPSLVMHIACTEPTEVVIVAVLIVAWILQALVPCYLGSMLKLAFGTAAQPKLILSSAYSPQLFSSHHPTSLQPPGAGSVSTVLKEEKLYLIQVDSFLLMTCVSIFKWRWLIFRNKIPCHRWAVLVKFSCS